ncbi:hypothetical protein ACIBTP_04215 [Streptomyces avidinii]|uniref:hypothetical protein n=1 Tax=Streptomyces avidinii TaxID=1895 RepID=UPI003791B88F
MNHRLCDLGALSALPELRLLGLDQCRDVSLDGLRVLALETLYLYRLGGVDLRPLADLAGLRHLGLDLIPEQRSVAELPVGGDLTGFGLYQKAVGLSLDGLARWPNLSWLTVSGAEQASELARMPAPPPLTVLQLLGHPALDLSGLVRHQGLKEIFLGACELTGGVEPLRELPEPACLNMADCLPVVDIGPLAGLPGLRVVVSGSNRLTGTEGFPPERLVAHGS